MSRFAPLSIGQQYVFEPEWVGYHYTPTASSDFPQDTPTPQCHQTFHRICLLPHRRQTSVNIRPQLRRASHKIRLLPQCHQTSLKIRPRCHQTFHMIRLLPHCRQTSLKIRRQRLQRALMTLSFPLSIAQVYSFLHSIGWPRTTSIVPLLATLYHHQ